MKIIVSLLLILLWASPVHAQELHQELKGIWHAEVVSISNEHEVIVAGADIETPIQTLTVKILEGDRENEFVTFENDYIQLEEGEKFYLSYLSTINGDELYSVQVRDRTGTLYVVIGLFAATILIFGGKQGVRALLSLAGSLFVIVYILVPTLVQGYSPVLVSAVVASLILFFAVFFTHGFNRRSVIAFSGTLMAVLLTGIIAYLSIDSAGFTGLVSDETTYLNLNTNGQLDFVGLLLAGIIIGSLGVLDDIAVTQVAVVRELLNAKTPLTKYEVYLRALRVGREHVGALVNTLILAYTGAALPLILLFSFSQSSVLEIINREIFATEIIRSLAGSIGLVFTVPITTFLAAYFLEPSDEEVEPHIH